MIPMLCATLLAAAPTPGSPVAPPPRAAPEVVIIAPLGISIPLDHNGLAFMIDTPSAAISMFEPDAKLALDPLATLSQIAHLQNFEITRAGTVRALTLRLPAFPRIEGEFTVHYLLVRPDGSAEFAVASAKDPAESLVLRQDQAADTLVTIRATAAPSDLTLTAEDGAVRISRTAAPD